MDYYITLHLLPFVISDYLFSFVNNQFLPNHFRTWLLLAVFLVGLVTVSRTDFLIGQIKFNLKPLKVFHFLKNNIKMKHKLNDSDYKRLAIVSRLTIIFLVENGSMFCTIIFIVFLYYRLRFKQFNYQINSILSYDNPNFIDKRKVNQLNKLINEHNSLSMEIYKLNMIFNRFVATIFFCFTFIKIIDQLIN